MPPHAKPKKARRIKPGSSPTYLDLIRQLPCILSGRPAEAAHIRYADAKHGKPETGAARKPDDRWCLPLAPELFSPRADYLLQVRGNSMSGVGILDGDLLAVHRTAEARSGQIVVVRLEDEVTVTVPAPANV
jgi:hypothetical protein